MNNNLPTINDMLIKNHQDIVSFIWNIAELLRGDYKQNEYQDVILPFTVLKRLDSVLEPTKDKVLEKFKQVKGKIDNYDPLLKSASGYPFYNTSKYTFKKLTQDPENIASNLKQYINGFSKNMYEVIEYFEFFKEIEKLDRRNLLFLVIEEFNKIDLHPDKVSNHEMGTVYEELIRRFNEQSNEAAGEHFTPREIIRLMVCLIMAGNGELKKENIIKTVYDPACGTGGMLTIAKDEIVHNINLTARVYLFGQELNEKTYAVAKSDIIIKGENPDNIKQGNTLDNDQLPDEKFDFMLSNPPFGEDWKKVQKYVKDEHDNLGFNGRFGPGLPRVSDGSLLFLIHMISKMKPVDEGGSRIAIVFNGSPLFTGDAGSGESEIRKWIIENDWLEAIIGLPDRLFYNTGIHTYIWLVNNHKPEVRRGKVQLIDARELYRILRKPLNEKRHEISEEQIEQIVSLYQNFEEKGKSKIFDNTFFGYRKIIVEQPKKDDKGNILHKKSGDTEPDPELRDTERVSLSEDIHEYFEKEVKPFAKDAWIDEGKTKIGYEINFTRYFYKYKPPRDLIEISKEINATKKEIDSLFKELIN